jgi:hypothetical protein
MELPNDVVVHNEQLGLKGVPAVLLEISSNGYYELNVRVGENTHRVLLPIASTRITAQAAEVAVGGVAVEVER